MRALVSIIGETNRQITAVKATLAATLEQHPDAAVYLSQPGLGNVLGARAPGEFGDDPDRYTSAKSPRTTPGHRPSSSPRDANTPWSQGTSVTGVSTTLWTNGRSVP